MCGMIIEMTSIVCLIYIICWFWSYLWAKHMELLKASSKLFTKIVCPNKTYTHGLITVTIKTPEQNVLI
jgi:hypothetical protein